MSDKAGPIATIKYRIGIPTKKSNSDKTIHINIFPPDIVCFDCAPHLTHATDLSLTSVLHSLHVVIGILKSLLFYSFENPVTLTS